MADKDDLNAQLFGRDLFGDAIAPKPPGPVHERFLQPPFSVLDGRQGEWQDRKRAWIGLGIKSEEGRGEGLVYSGVTIQMFDHYRVQEGTRTSSGQQGTSIFDPVLCECAYRWWCPVGGQIVDPFAGGSVRGIVATSLGMRYWGCDLSSKQIEANRAQLSEVPHGAHDPVWVSGDSVDTLGDAPEADFVFSCPPYGDLEVYSDDPRDLSTMEYAQFLEKYQRIIFRAAFKLRMNRFACFVVADFRNPSNGMYRDFVSETIRAFRMAGLQLYNNAILVSPVGTASLRVTRQFNGGRKLVKCHQDVLVFVKGDPKLAAASAMAAPDWGDAPAGLVDGVVNAMNGSEAP